MVETVNKEITAISRDFESIRQIAKEFCASVNVSLDEIDLEIDAVLPKKRARKKIEFLPNACHVSSRRIRDRWQWAGRIRRWW